MTQETMLDDEVLDDEVIRQMNQETTINDVSHW